ncbi:MAG TPA: MBL fold metallo-hydrolase [Bacillota bacterium]|nr:MBL fold metallo-hydrolase [Bacillota bacterium]
MQQTQTRITYLYHSGFTVETADCFLIFDYYQPAVKQAKTTAGILTRELLETKSRVYVFASHSHADHFDPAILTWADLTTVNYIMSSDIRVNPPLPRSHLLSPYETFRDNRLAVQTFGSTDQGVSFLVETGNFTLFHAGDLNWWQWSEDSPTDQAKAVSDFKAEIAKIAGHRIDLAFFPVDRRLEEYYAHGALYFAAQLRPKLLIPMHFGSDYQATAAFADQARNLSINTLEITHRGQEFTF